MAGRGRAGISTTTQTRSGWPANRRDVGNENTTNLAGTGNPDGNGAFNISLNTTATPMARNLSVHFDDPFSRMRRGEWLIGRAEGDVKVLLIDM